MRVKSAIWVAAYLRRCQNEGAFAAVRQRGNEEAGAIFIKINRLNGTATLFVPAPQSAFDEARPEDRAVSHAFGETAVDDKKAEERLTQEMRFDPDIWILEIEDRQGRSFLERVV
jgi:hypothetical protein